MTDQEKTRFVEFKVSHKVSPLPFEKGDRKHLPWDQATRYVDAGICKCLETEEDNQLKPGVHVAQPKSTKQVVADA
ncbi:MAG: hypothetical protein AAF662_02240 [Pseudomonadota bacterium]